MSEASIAFVVERTDFQSLFDALESRGYRVVGPTVREGAIVYSEVRSVDALPAGWTDEQEGATYRLKARGDRALFGYAVGPHSWKKFLFPSLKRLLTADRAGEVLHITQEPVDDRAYAFIGVRSCELHAMAIQDKVFMEGPGSNAGYRARRERAFIVALNCGTAGGTCFCVSMNTGPKVTSPYDLALTELLDSTRHAFLVEVGSERGAEVMADVPHRDARSADQEQAVAVVEQTAGQMGRTMDTAGIKELLYSNFEHPRWNDVADRCLSCANCTMVCPTCFCSTVEDTSSLSGDHAERSQAWDSCFSGDFSFVHGGSVRPNTRSRYRQWMTHKLATWFDQFGTSGCVGCGRCITWCPVAIDITEEVAAIRASNGAKGERNADRRA